MFLHADKRACMEYIDSMVRLINLEGLELSISDVIVFHADKRACTKYIV